MFGLLNIDKPANLTSHDVVARVRRLLPRKTKVGHAGTLDPFATGVLVLGVGQATRLTRFVMDSPKTYEAEVTFGHLSDTDDVTGEIRPTGIPSPGEDGLRHVLPRFLGAIEQTPPAYSAIHVDGERAYNLARSGKSVDLPSRPVRIDRLEVLSVTGETARFVIDCSKGTYIRSLARDIGAALGCGAYCSALRRTRVGAFLAEDAVAMERLGADGAEAHLLPPEQAVKDWPRVTVAESYLSRLRNGNTLPAELAAGIEPGTNMALFSPEARLIALAEVRVIGLQPTHVFLP